MRKVLVLITAIFVATGTWSAIPSGVAPSPMTLEKALKLGLEGTISYLKKTSSAEPFENLDHIEPTKTFPAEILKSTEPTPTVKRKEQLKTFLQTFKSMDLSQKVEKAKSLIKDFQCPNATEAQALALMLERNFPDTEARSMSLALHDKALTCDGDHKTETLIRLSLFAIQDKKCPEAMKYLAQFPTDIERGLKDRVTYLSNYCQPQKVVIPESPWGAYGVLLGDIKIPTKQEPLWFLSAASGNESWDRLLMTLVDLSEKNEIGKVRHIIRKLDHEKLKKLPSSFQASILTLLHHQEVHLQVFQILHAYINEHPEMITKELTDLFFPVRYWKEIKKFGQGMDPYLIKSIMRQESAFNPEAHSRADAMGLLQVAIKTAKSLGVKKPKLLQKPDINIKTGARYFLKQIEKFGSVEMALAAYNAGPYMIRDWRERYPTDNPDLFIELIPYPETREYVRLINRNYRVYKSLIK